MTVAAASGVIPVCSALNFGCKSVMGGGVIQFGTLVSWHPESHTAQEQSSETNVISCLNESVMVNPFNGCGGVFNLKLLKSGKLGKNAAWATRSLFPD